MTKAQEKFVKLLNECNTLGNNGHTQDGIDFTKNIEELKELLCDDDFTVPDNALVGLDELFKKSIFMSLCCMWKEFFFEQVGKVVAGRN